METKKDKLLRRVKALGVLGLGLITSCLMVTQAHALGSSGGFGSGGFTPTPTPAVSASDIPAVGVNKSRSRDIQGDRGDIVKVRGGVLIRDASGGGAQGNSVSMRAINSEVIEEDDGGIVIGSEVDHGLEEKSFEIANASYFDMNMKQLMTVEINN